MPAAMPDDADERRRGARGGAESAKKRGPCERVRARVLRGARLAGCISRGRRQRRDVLAAPRRAAREPRRALCRASSGSELASRTRLRPWSLAR